MTFKLSKRSLQRLEGVKPDLVRVVERAIELTKVDFGVVRGLRTPEEQAANVAKGASQTLNSKHLTGDAVDLVAYIGPNISWDEKYYPTIADAMKAAAIELGVPVRWGGAWHVADIRKWEGTMEEAMLDYARKRRAEGREPFLDLGHFELTRA